jgi:prolipoprotein diacylglyceryltransferase
MRPAEILWKADCYFGRAKSKFVTAGLNFMMARWNFITPRWNFITTSLNALLLFLIVSAVWHRTRHRPGTTLTVACVLYGSTRFFWEFLRDPAVGGTVSGLSLLQITALVGIGIAGVIGVMTLRRGVAQSGRHE